MDFLQPTGYGCLPCFTALLPTPLHPGLAEAPHKDGSKEIALPLFRVQIVLHLLSFFGLAQRADAEGDLPFIDSRLMTSASTSISDFEKAEGLSTLSYLTETHE